MTEKASAPEPTSTRQPDGLVWLAILIVMLILAEATFFTVAHLLPDDRLPVAEQGD